MRSRIIVEERECRVRGGIVSGLVACVLALVLLVSAAQNAYAADSASMGSGTEQQVVHVGFFRFGGYHNMSGSGEKSGYGYDFLQMISGYANFRYVYVGYQKSWSDMLDMLDNGEIDMLTYGVKIPAYEGRFDFSEHSIGTSSEILTTSVNNTVFAANDYMPFDGMRVGMIQANNLKPALDAYATGKGISYTPVYYSDIDSMQAALKDGGEIDAMVADEMRVLSDEIVIDKFDTHDLYVMVRKGNTQLLDTVDESIRKLDAANPGWAIELKSKYFLSSVSAGLPVTLSESQSIQNLTSEGKTLKVLFNPVRYPLGYYQNGEARGALVDIFKRIASEYGLPYEFIKTDSVEEYNDLRKKGEADIVLDFVESTDEAEVLGYRLTSSYADSGYSSITTRDFNGTPQTVALITGSKSFYDIAKNINPKVKVTYYDDFDACVRAVKNGDVDCTYTYSITAQMYVLEDSKNRIKATQMNDQTFQFRMAMNSKTDMVLYGLLNKATHNLNSSDTEQTFNSYLLEAKRNYSFWNYLVDNPVLMISMIVVVLVILIGFIMAQRKNARKLEVSNDALNASRDALEGALVAANDANAAKTRFLSQMSHDIRTPLNGIIGMTEIAADNVDDPVRVTDALEKISTSSDHLLTLINDILDLNRIESGKMKIAHDPTDIRETIGQCIEVLKSSVINRKLEVVTEVEPIESPFVLTDALHIRQILINLISNAVKFTPDGGRVVFRVASHPDAKERNLLCRFEVADTGIGMGKEFQEQIFEAFVQEDAFDARTQFKGSGLGMAIVKQFVDMLEGTIEIESEPDMGTTVIVELPLEIDREWRRLREADGDEDASSEFDMDGLRILLVEDNPINREVAQVLLEGRGAIVETAVDGRVAVERFMASEPDEYQCILMDVMMPNMDGYEATEAIRELDRPDAKRVPIIAMTANAFAEDVRAALDSGMDAHVAKPIDLRTLLQTLAKLIRR